MFLHLEPEQVCIPQPSLQTQIYSNILFVHQKIQRRLYGFLFYFYLPAGFNPESFFKRQYFRQTTVLELDAVTI